MATHKPFREILPAGTNFEFVGKTRLWVTISLLAVAASIAMVFVNKATSGSYLNWTIDFKGGTELIFRFDGEKPIKPGDVRGALSDQAGIEVSEYAWQEDLPDGSKHTVNGLRVRTPEYGAVPENLRVQYSDEFAKKFASKDVLKVGWSGDTMYARTKAPFTEAEAGEFFAAIGLEMKPWKLSEGEEGEAAGDDGGQASRMQEGTDEYNTQFSIWGLDRQYEKRLSEAFGGTSVKVVQVYGVGPKAGQKLVNDGAKSLFYALILIMLYLVVRFDIRYAPGAAVALLHDGILVIGVFAVTWTDFSLTSVAALLTVIGYSVNDTVIIFDRIRENVARLKDKKLPRIINISLNETLSRTLLTSLTLFVVTLMMNIFGTGLVSNFAFAMNIGVVVGTYSSVFVASPIMLFLHNRYFAGPAKA